MQVHMNIRKILQEIAPETLQVYKIYTSLQDIQEG